MYDGIGDRDPLLAALNGEYQVDNMPRIQSTGPNLFIHFYSDMALVGAGFYARWSMSPCPFNCSNGNGDCVFDNSTNNYTCNCYPGYYGSTCEYGECAVISRPPACDSLSSACIPSDDIAVPPPRDAPHMIKMMTSSFKCNGTGSWDTVVPTSETDPSVSAPERFCSADRPDDDPALDRTAYSYAEIPRTFYKDVDVSVIMPNILSNYSRCDSNDCDPVAITQSDLLRSPEIVLHDALRDVMYHNYTRRRELLVHSLAVFGGYKFAPRPITNKYLNDILYVHVCTMVTVRVHNYQYFNNSHYQYINQSIGSDTHGASWRGGCMLNNITSCLSYSTPSGTVLSLERAWICGVDHKTSSSSPPLGRFQSSLVYYKGALYLYGGKDASRNTLSSMYRYNMTTDAWTMMATPSIRHADVCTRDVNVIVRDSVILPL